MHFKELTTLSVSKNHIRQIRYDVIGAFDYGIKKHPQINMKEKGINLIAAIPETIADCWICLTDFQGDLPPYITEIEIELHSDYWKNWEIDLIE